MNVSVIAPWITALLNGAASLALLARRSVGRRKEEAAHADRGRFHFCSLPNFKVYLLKCSETSGLINLCIKRDLHSRAYTYSTAMPHR
jgi:hypothetical protein